MHEGLGELHADEPGAQHGHARPVPQVPAQGAQVGEAREREQLDVGRVLERRAQRLRARGEQQRVVVEGRAVAQSHLAALGVECHDLGAEAQPAAAAREEAFGAQRDPRFVDPPGEQMRQHGR